MDLTKLTNNIQAMLDEAGNIEVGGVNLESCDVKLLLIDSDSIDRHVVIQPAAIAWAGMNKKEAARQLEAIEQAKDRWEKLEYAKARVVLESRFANKSAIKVEDIKAEMVKLNEVKVIEWEERVAEAHRKHDLLSEYYEAWRQKSFTIREFVSIDEEERFSGSGSITKGDNRGGPRRDIVIDSAKTARIKAIIRKSHGQSARVQ